MKLRLLLFALLLALPAIARADEIRLKDGSKIVGTIVDFENDSFKVQTVYGFAMVRKDSIAQIIPSDPVKSADSSKPDGAKPAAAAITPATAKPATAQTPAVATASATLSSPNAKPEAQSAVMRGATAAGAASPSVTARPMPAPNPRSTPATLAAAAPATAATATTTAPASATAPAPVPALAPAPVVPAPIRESIQGTLYTNQTYNFQFYRPPGWELLPEARKAMPNAITAMGTSDETALFIVGREALKGSLDAQASNAQKSLQKIYENYRQISSTKRTVAGLPAVEWRFRGVADGHDWSVTALAIARGTDVFTLLGMTYADSDLIQIRENVIGKMLASLQFSPAP